MGSSDIGMEEVPFPHIDEVSPYQILLHLKINYS